MSRNYNVLFPDRGEYMHSLLQRTSNACVLLAVIASVLLAPSVAAAEQPNIVFIISADHDN